ncbi:MAG: CRISPR-associated endonuclease Cas1 [Bdellovibrio sp.]|nr:CRISPR-associated endonuclease Cas1 [Bdellovibrio sp.]
MKQLGRIIYIDGYGNFIGCENNKLYIKTKESPSKFFFHYFDLDAVVVNAHCSFSSQAIIDLNQNGVEVVFSDWAGKYQGRFEGPKNKNIFVRRAQIFAANSLEKTMRISKEIVACKIEAMHSCYAYPDIQEILQKIASCIGYEELLGIEGHYSKIYFQNLAPIIENLKLKFEGRKFHPSPDPINSLLSMAYNLLFVEAGIVARTFGFDSAFGFLHRDYYGRESLICDLMEPFRSTLADQYVLFAIAEIGIKSSDFKTIESECSFDNKEKRTHFYKLFRSEFFNDQHREQMLDFARSIYNLIIDSPDEGILITENEKKVA